MSDEEIINLALDGFMISTGFGEEPGKSMPVSDAKTLIEFARSVMRESKEPTEAQVEAATAKYNEPTTIDVSKGDAILWLPGECRRPMEAALKAAAEVK